jgi:polyphosphate glucokinase
VSILGIDIGGSGIKGAPVDVRRGRVLTERFRLETPQPARPDAVLDTVAKVIANFEWGTDPIGVTFPGVVQQGIIRTAANVDKSWIGQDLVELLRSRTQAPVFALNDADAAGVAEVAHGAAKGVRGTVIMLTFGTGIGCGMFYDGKLVPNTELGHLEVDGNEAEKRAAESVRERDDLTWKQWAKRANEYLEALENLLWPDLLVIGGGITKKTDKWLSLLKARAEIRVASFGNEAGIIGAAMTASRAARSTRSSTSARS